ncbi:MAG: 23S rRNA (adenine(2503)-C(2))-methyltransferase RlmN [Bacillota bacterium]
MVRIKRNILAMQRSELEDFLETLGEKKYRAAQIIDWVYKKRVFDFAAMSNLPQRLINRLDDDACIPVPAMLQRRSSRHTAKYLFALEDGNTVESVLMLYSYGNAACVSTQAGCGMGCSFCASAIGGKKRDLLAWEIIAQVLLIQKDLDGQGQRVSHVTIMGTGEPLDNYDAVVSAIRLLGEYLGIGQRRITVSTCGLVPEIKRLQSEQLAVTLSISLHATDNRLRDRLMPVNRRYPVEQVVAAGRQYGKVTGRRVSYEYIMLKGVNDHPEHARKLAALLSGSLCHVNLIAWNVVPGRPFAPSDRSTIERFSTILSKMGIPVTIRREMGGEIQAACGQLRRGQAEVETE